MRPPPHPHPQSQWVGPELKEVNLREASHSIAIRLPFRLTVCAGEATRSYLYVEDVAEAFDVILHRGSVGQTYNIGTQKERTVAEVAADIAKHFGLPEQKITHVRDRAFNDRRLAAPPSPTSPPPLWSNIGGCMAPFFLYP